MTERRSYDAVDLCKFILSIMVAALHTNPYAPWRAYRFPWYRTAVPIFFVLSGFFLWSKVAADKQNADKTVKSFLLRDLKLYIAWFVVLLPVTLYIQRYFAEGFLPGIKALILGFCFGSTFRASWYLSALIIAVLIVYLAGKKLPNSVLLSFGICIHILICLTYTYGNLWPEESFFTVLRNAYPKSMCFSFPVALVWIAMGKLLAENRDRLLSIKHPCRGLAVSSLLLWMESRLVAALHYDYTSDCLILLIPTVFFAVICMLKATAAIPHAKFLRRASTVIYCSHYSVCFVEGAAICALGFDLQSTLGGTLQFICAILTGIAMTIVIQKLETVNCFRWVKYFY